MISLPAEKEQHHFLDLAKNRDFEKLRKLVEENPLHPERFSLFRKAENKSKGKGVKPTRKQDSNKDSHRKGESVLLLNFLHCWASGLFSALAIASVSAANICLQTAVKVAKLPIAGRASLCLNNWNVVSGSGWIRNVVRDGYKLLYTAGPPPTPHTVANLPVQSSVPQIHSV